MSPLKETGAPEHSGNCASTRTNPHGAMYACDCAAGVGKKRFDVIAVIKHHCDVGCFAADSEDEAKQLAEQSESYVRIAYARRNYGGVYDLQAYEVKPVPDPVGDALRAMPVVGMLYIDDPRDPLNKELKL